MPGLAGAMDESPDADAVFDITELASMLLIPHLRKEGAGEDPEQLFGPVLDMIMLDVTGSTKPAVLDRAMMKRIMAAYGEDDVPPEVIDEMLQAAGAAREGVTDFDYKVLVQATTGDIQQVNPDWQDTPTTHYDDVLDGTALDANLEDNDPDEEISKSKLDDSGNAVQRIFTATTIDFVAENYRSKAFNVILWVLVVVGFFTYAFQFQTALGS